MHRCEALLLQRGKYVPCGSTPADLHHKITRARGGEILDKAGEDYHLMRLCREHHDYAHDSDEAYDGGLLLRGYVFTGRSGVVYIGPDDYLSGKYPKP
jgi:5-methylcytosine-specific restriction endonuclease McrA